MQTNCTQDKQIIVFYKVILDKDGYRAVPKNAVESKTHTEIQQKDIVNTNLYEIKSNTDDSCIRFNLNMIKKNGISQ